MNKHEAKLQFEPAAILYTTLTAKIFFLNWKYETFTDV